MVNSVLSGLLAGLFPDYCCLCGLRSNCLLPLCIHCEHELQANTLCCTRCAIPLPDAGSHTGLRMCGHCLQTPPPFQRVIAPWLYCERFAYLIGRWKFHGERRLTPLLTTLWLQQAGATFEVDLIIPVPLHWRRLWRRGFNQSELLCRELSAMTPAGAPLAVDHRCVRRSRHTPAQSGVGAAQRRANVRGAFTVSRRYDNLTVAIVDDVYTTGATATAMALALQAAGASRVEVWCLARTPAPHS